MAGEGAQDLKSIYTRFFVFIAVVMVVVVLEMGEGMQGI